MDKLLLVEYRWSDMPKGEWRHMFISNSMDAVFVYLNMDFVYDNECWSKTWENDWTTYTRRHVNTHYQTARIRPVTLVTMQWLDV